MKRRKVELLHSKRFSEFFFVLVFLKQFLVKLLSFILLGAFDINPAANNIGISYREFSFIPALKIKLSPIMSLLFHLFVIAFE